MSFTLGRSRWADLTVASVASLLGALATFLVMVTLLLSFQQRGASGLQVAALAVCEALPLVALGRPIGRLVDRVDSRWLLVAAGLAAAVACLALAQADGVPAMLGGVVALALAAAVFTPTLRALIPAMVVRDDLPRASAIGQTAGSIGMMVGPALAGILVGGSGPHTTIRLAALVWLAAVTTTLFIRSRRGGPARSAEPARVTGRTSGEWTLRHDPLLRLSVWGVTAVITFASVVNVVLVFFVMGTLRGEPEAYGIIDASWMVGLLAGAWLAGLTVRAATSDPALVRRVVLASAVVCGAIVVTGSVGSPWWIVPCFFVGGAGNAAINVFTGTLVGRRAPAAARGRVNTAMGMRVQAGSLVGFVGGGLLLAVGEPRWIIIGCGLAGLAAAAVALAIGRRPTAGVTEPALDRPDPVPSVAV